MTRITRLLRVLLVVMVAAVSVSVLISTADARPKKPGAAESQKKSCKLPGKMGTLEHGGELLEEHQSGGGYNVYTCNNGTVCVKVINSDGTQGNADGDCWYDPAMAFPRPSGGATLAPSVVLATTR
jgi:hypothetical protein